MNVIWISLSFLSKATHIDRSDTIVRKRSWLSGGLRLGLYCELSWNVQNKIAIMLEIRKQLVQRPKSFKTLLEEIWHHHDNDCLPHSKLYTPECHFDLLENWRLMNREEIHLSKHDASCLDWLWNETVYHQGLKLGGAIADLEILCVHFDDHGHRAVKPMEIWVKLLISPCIARYPTCELLWFIVIIRRWSGKGQTISLVEAIRRIRNGSHEWPGSGIEQPIISHSGKTSDRAMIKSFKTIDLWVEFWKEISSFVIHIWSIIWKCVASR
jgi:hypothetical protein